MIFSDTLILSRELPHYFLSNDESSCLYHTWLSSLQGSTRSCDSVIIRM